MEAKTVQEPLLRREKMCSRDRDLKRDVLTEAFTQANIPQLYGSLELERATSKIAKRTEISEPLVQRPLMRFLKDLKNLRAFYRATPISWSHDVRGLARKARIYLHKIHRLAPVFDYKRARGNLLKLHRLFRHHNFWPVVSTQLALTVFVTDHMKRDGSSPLQQVNIIYLCVSSAYAFHMARKRINLDQYLGGE